MTQMANSQMRRHIEEFFDQVDLDVVCHKRKRGYSIRWANDHEPFLRLRPTGSGDEVELFSWDGDRWRKVNDFGLELPLNDALEHVLTDPDGVFFDDDKPEQDSTSHQASSPPPKHLCEVAASIHAHLLIPSALGGGCGGFFQGGWLGLACGAASGYLVACLLGLNSGILRSGKFMFIVLLLLLPMAITGGVGGLIGGAVHQAIGGGIVGGAAGVTVGVTCSLLVFCGGWVSWLIGFSSGVTLGIMLMNTIGSERNLVGIVVTALLAAGLGKLFQRVTDDYRRWSSPLIRAYSTRTEAQWKTRRSVTRTSAD